MTKMTCYTRKMDKTKLILPGSIILAALLISGSVMYSRPSGTAAIGDKPELAGPVKVDISGSPFLGAANASVTIVEFGDYQCPFCRLYFENIQKKLSEEYIGTDKVKFVWMDYAFLGEESMWSAQAARCAGEQDKFWQYHDHLYSHQGGENVNAFSKANLKKFAASLGLNTNAFNSCLDSDKYATEIQEQTQYGSSIGVTGTPATFINGVKISGAVPYSQIKAAVEAILSK